MNKIDWFSNRQSCELFLHDLNSNNTIEYNIVSFEKNNFCEDNRAIETIKTILGMDIRRFSIDHELLSQILKTMITYYKSKETEL